MILELIDEARATGARQRTACEIVELNERTVQRWRVQGGGEDRRCGPNTEPKNKLSDRERDDILQTVNSREFRDLSPKQIVPALASQGRYLARNLRSTDSCARRTN
jgi:hypothetical protein